MGCNCGKEKDEEEVPQKAKSPPSSSDLADGCHENEGLEMEETGDRYVNEPKVSIHREKTDSDDIKAKRKTILSPHLIECFIKEGKQLSRSLYNYTGNEDDNSMDMTKGDVLEVLHWDGDWCHAKNLETEEEGYVPRSYIALESGLECHEWFHGEVSRADGVKMLKASHKPGTFLIRESETKKGSYSLSVLDENSVKGRFVRHYRIKNMDFGGCYIFESNKFESLADMVDFYSKTIEKTMSSQLLYPCAKPQPRIWDLSRTTRDNWEIPRSELELIELLGAGNFGEVWKGRWKGKTYVAVKTMKDGSMEPAKFLEEAAIMKKLQHPKIIRLYAVCTKEEPFYIVSELMPNGSLKDYLTKNKDALELPEIVYIATQVADGMWYIEREHLIHRDLAARNVLLGTDFQIKIGDFGMAKVIDEDIYVAQHGAKCPLKWTAPEAVIYQNYTIKSDVWSFGVLLVELTTGGATPYPGLKNHELVIKLDKGYRHPRPEKCPEALYDDVMLKCWDTAPDARPSFEDLCKQLEEFPVD